MQRSEASASGDLQSSIVAVDREAEVVFFVVLETLGVQFLDTLQRFRLDGFFHELCIALGDDSICLCGNMC